MDDRDSEFIAGFSFLRGKDAEAPIESRQQSLWSTLRSTRYKRRKQNLVVNDSSQTAILAGNVM